MYRSFLAPKSNLASAESVASMRWKPPARDHSSRPAAVRLVPTPGFHDPAESTKNAAKGSAHMVAGKPHRKHAQIIRTKATALATRTQSSLLRLTISRLVVAHLPAALFMSTLALLSLSPDLTVFFAWNTDPGVVTLSRLATAMLTGSTPAHWPG
ncbi:Uncharacterised protein [Mycolicibacterium vanbaalenii]|uniref:Uncharacterized protein n=1 Tax=Mycolicibacterium vanbaalenii TaxID=110539 RepID=A0A5S9R9U2_MYCVN|nr:Uncharacterised protein [Mycolicibacterium vanbaalenii]